MSKSARRQAGPRSVRGGKGPDAVAGPGEERAPCCGESADRPRCPVGAALRSVRRRSIVGLWWRTQQRQTCQTVGTAQAGAGVPALPGLITDTFTSNLDVSYSDFV